MTTNTTTTTHLLAIPPSVGSDDRVALLMAAQRDRKGFWYSADHQTVFIAATDLTLLMKFVSKAPNMRDILPSLKWFVADGVDFPNARPAASPF